MTTKDEALKLVLEALEDPLAPTKRLKAIAAIKEVLAQPEQEPVKIAHRHEWFRTGEMKIGQMRCIGCGKWGQEEAPQRTWVGLTDEDIEWCYEKQKQTFYRYKYSVHGQQITKFDDPDYHFILAVTAKLKQKNGFAEEKNT